MQTSKMENFATKVNSILMCPFQMLTGIVPTPLINIIPSRHLLAHSQQ